MLEKFLIKSGLLYFIFVILFFRKKEWFQVNYVIIFNEYKFKEKNNMRAQDEFE